jgi:hypothetical protein
MRFVRTSVLFALAVAFTLFSGTSLFAQSTDADSQQFTVVVGDAISITAPADVSINHNLADVDQPFAQQTWNVYTSNALGAGVVLDMGRFINTSNASFFREGQLDLAVLSSDATATWVVGTASDDTSGSGTASVDGSSTGPGSGQLGVSVTFLETDASTLASGDYVATVTGTITNN